MKSPWLRNKVCKVCGHVWDGYYHKIMWKDNGMEILYFCEFCVKHFPERCRKVMGL